ncbi:MarR family winged helix-turn-helix transcriptional regulator [Dehalococcoides mccartyi]|jgi:DNA-binding MarR family transcriptional regulator|uniref:MarR family transcriptional regulator n=2 Tax=Dehalococcoides mccartyi TaxID=61435 RepID=A0A142VBR8_9CHLR|nr:MarR family transcriptional regulator [Dehalococcoides mccartyi]AGG08506.1 transcriptional regulator, MarR family [Dehalococcoides mccartyi BTF08]AII61495.1 MarR family transcriptional regulator [Dehalococcoides mccartyi CG5]AMU87280.1 MarR family transcriptional regulator [Dehalococcoides mccartyi]AQX73806.1 MarR family transcriptional regulator [Dehalococcoides mccartyi]MBA2084270.1 Transcriptional regulator, MarR family [Dehalococcoides mccartyi]
MSNFFLFDFEDKNIELFGIIMRTRNILYKLSKRNLHRLDISPEQSTILMVVKNSPVAPTPIQISRQLLREPHTIAVNLKRMQSRGLVTLEQDSEWKNRIRVNLTDKGRQICEESFNPEFFQEVFQDLNEKEIDQFKGILEKLLVSGMKKLKIKDTIDL